MDQKIKDLINSIEWPKPSLLSVRVRQRFFNSLSEEEKAAIQEMEEHYWRKAFVHEKGEEKYL